MRIYSILAGMLSLAITLFANFTSYGQTHSQYGVDGLPDKHTSFGNARIRHCEKPECPTWTTANVRLTLKGGKPGDVVTSPETAGIRVIRDTLGLTLAYFAPQNLKPREASVVITSYSTKDHRYAADPRLTIIADGRTVLSRKMELESSITVAERFRLTISYDDLLEITKAKDITIQIGDTQVQVPPLEIKAFNELNRTTRILAEPLNCSCGCAG
jgi:hypothetical protein